MSRVSIAAIVVAALGAALLAQPTPAPLFEETGSDVATTEMLGSVRSRAAGIDLSLIGGVDGALAPVQRLRLNLFPGTDLVATLDRFEQTEWGASWSGIIDGTAFGDVILVNVNGFVSGRVSALGRSFAIRGRGELVTVAEIDEDLLPEAADDALEPPLTNTGDLDLDVSADDGSVIDIGVIYSVDSARAAGGDDAIRADIGVAVRVANNAFLWSGVDTRLRLRVLGRYTGGDSGDMVRDLIGAALRSASVQRFRDSHRLDLIALVVENDRRRCGAAFVNNLNSTGLTAHSITNRQCLLTHTLAHEIGHTLGLPHSPRFSDYDNLMDIMSQIEDDRKLNVGTIAINRYAAGWIDPGQVAIFEGAGRQRDRPASADPPHQP